MSTLYLVVDKDPKVKSINKSTESSLKAILQKDDAIIFKETDDFEIFSKFKTTEQYDYVCLIPNNSEINKDYVTIISDYEDKSKEEKIILLPLVVLLLEKTKGILNTAVWNNNLVEEVGVLTHNLAMMQVDTTLFGALIPFDLFFDENNYKKDLKYYQHFYFLNKVTADEKNLVYGVPKTLLYTNIDLSFPDATNEEKIENFKQAKQIA